MIFFHDRWPVFYEDNHLLVVYKPAGLIMQRDIKNKANMLDLAKLWIKMRYNKPGKAFAGLVHRLDGAVAGVVVIARTSKGASRLSAQIRNGAVKKQYLAVVQGRPPKAEDRLCQHLVRNGRLSRVVSTETNGSQKASLHYRLIATRSRRSLMVITLETGRRHQIRAQLAYMDCPIIGDLRYGAATPLAHGRIGLLAHRLGFDHPTLGDRLEFEAPQPEGWPWPSKTESKQAPCWTLEDFFDNGLVLSKL